MEGRDVLSMELHWFVALNNVDLVAVLLEDLYAIRPVLIAIGLGVHLAIVGLEVPAVLHLALFDDAEINVRTRAEIVVDSSFDGLDDEGLGLLLSHILLELAFKNGHRRQRTRAHAQERPGLVVAVRVDLDELGSFHVDATDDTVRSNVATVAEDVVGEPSDCHLDAALAVRVEPVQLQVALDHF